MALAACVVISLVCAWVGTKIVWSITIACTRAVNLAAAQPPRMIGAMRTLLRDFVQLVSVKEEQCRRFTLTMLHVYLN